MFLVVLNVECRFCYIECCEELCGSFLLVNHKHVTHQPAYNIFLFPLEAIVLLPFVSFSFFHVGLFCVDSAVCCLVCERNIYFSYFQMLSVAFVILNAVKNYVVPSCW
eukprot:GHVS01066511.1.p1 GENE.GHVS01066511.1~~GHVS01066511.1.p1  ORF type:complete len:108 (+),score=8.02 GHVS01066511.1:651-974(+)